MREVTAEATLGVCGLPGEAGPVPSCGRTVTGVAGALRGPNRLTLTTTLGRELGLRSGSGAQEVVGS